MTIVGLFVARRAFFFGLVSLAAHATGSSPGSAVPLGPIPVPPENPITEEKRVLGKVLFWDEQLSSTNTMACGTCHRPSDGSVDPREGRHPGYDGVLHTDDDILGSPTFPRTDKLGRPVNDPVFGTDPQVTGRTAPAVIGSQYSNHMFWDGRAANVYVDPLTNETLIVDGGNFETQALGPILAASEMAWEKREWRDVTKKLRGSTPLALATNLPPDVQAAIDVNETYPRLFEAAFGDEEITPTRIVFALATYERTQFPNETPWDAFEAGDEDALTPNQRRGWEVFLTTSCAVCHNPPMFTDTTFRNIGLRPIEEDGGAGLITGADDELGQFKVPSLRNVIDRPRLMHTGQITDVRDAIDFYLGRGGHVQFTKNQDFLIGRLVDELAVEDIDAVVDFIENALTDPRVAAETFPFDRPTLRSEALFAGGGRNSSSYLTVLPNTPNPFPGTTTLRFHLADRGASRLTVFDAQGRRVRVLVDGAFDSGTASVVWNGTDDAGRVVASGVYFYEFTHRTGSASDRVTGRMVFTP